MLPREQFMVEKREARRASRAHWPVRVFRLGEEPGADLSRTTTAEERLAMMWPLAREAWTLAGGSLPDYPRHRMPIRVIRPAAAAPWLERRLPRSAAAFCDAGVRFIVVGAHAMAVHGVPRATGDLDVWIECTGANAARAWRALLDFGAPVEALDVSRDDLERPARSFSSACPRVESTC